MQLFATNQNSPGEDIGAGIRTGEITVAPIVADTVYNTSSPEWNPCHLNRPNGQAKCTKQTDIDNQHQQNAARTELGIHVALEPIVRCAMPELAKRFSIF